MHKARWNIRLQSVSNDQALKSMVRFASFSLMFVLSVTGLLACSRPPPLVPHIVSQSPIDIALGLADTSPLIVLGTVVSEHIIGPRIAAGNDGHVRMQKVDLT